MRRTLTADQKAKRDSRRAEFRTLCKKVAGMSPEARAAILPHVGAVLTVEGRALSITNTMLCVSQRPGVSMVGGFRQWLKAGRCVSKGERGMMIWVPCGKRRDDVDGKDEPTGDERPGFICGTVFDVTQTAELTAGEAMERGVEVDQGEVRAEVGEEIGKAFGMDRLPATLVKLHPADVKVSADLSKVPAVAEVLKAPAQGEWDLWKS